MPGSSDEVSCNRKILR
jgi:hypothetical protein